MIERFMPMAFLWNNWLEPISRNKSDKVRYRVAFLLAKLLIFTNKTFTFIQSV